jgi:hypothetical protein
MSIERIAREIDNAIYQMGNNELDRDRPFDGQPHTDDGERGKTLVEGLRMRDVADCIVRGWLLSTGPSDAYSLAMAGKATYNDLYRDECAHVDPMAVVQNAMCEVERMMGIFPNCSPLTFDENGMPDA